MLICLDMRTGAGCGAQTVDNARFCEHCGQNLRFALLLHDVGTLVGAYRVGRVIGYGGFGAIYEAQSNAGEPVALKETFDTSSISTFAREFAVLSQLKHANLPRYIDMFEAEGNGYLVMEYVPGQSLQDILDEQPQNEHLLESQVLGYAIQLCDVLHYLHSQQPPILHRDVKPANVRLTPQGRIKLVDFGLLKQGGQQTRATIRGLGTLGYAPIEQYGHDERATNPRSDVYSLGATLYHLLTGTQPTSAPVRISGTPDSLPALRDLRPDVSLQVANSITKAMSLFPKERFASTAEMKQALLGATQTKIKGSGTSTRPASGLHRRTTRPLTKDVTPSLRPSKQTETPAAPTSSLKKVTSWFKRTLLPSSTPDSTKKAPPPATTPDSSSVLRSTPPAVEIVPAQHELSLPHVVCDTSHDILGITYTPLGDKLIGMSTKGMLYEWWVSDGRLVQTHKLPDIRRVTHFAYSPTGDTFATISSGNKIHVWDARNRSLLYISQSDNSQKKDNLWYSPDGRLLITTIKSQRTINVWRISDKSLVYSREYFARKILGMAFSPNGLLFATGTNNIIDKIHLLLAADGSLVRKTKQRSAAYSIAWHPNSEYFASGDREKVTIWHAKEGQRQQEFIGHSGAITHLLWHPSGKLILSGSEDKTVCLWALQEPFLQYKLSTHQGKITGLVVAPNGRTIVTTSKDKSVRIWHLPEHYQVEVAMQATPLDEFRPAQPAFHKNQRKADTAEMLEQLPLTQNTIKKIGGWAGEVWHGSQRFGQASKDIVKSIWLASYEPEMTPATSPQAYHVEANYGWNLPSKSLNVNGSILKIRYSASGLHVLGISNQKTVYLWRVEDGKVLQMMTLEGSGKLDIVAYSPTGQVIAGASDNEMMIRVWDAKSGRLQYALRGHTTTIKKLDFSPDGEHLISAGGKDCTLRTWHIKSGQLIRISNYSSGVLNVAYSPDSQFLAIMNDGLGYIGLRDVQTGKQIRQLGMANRSNDLAWHQNSQLIASNDDKSLCIWRINQAKRFKMFKGHTKSITHITWSPSGELIASASEDKTIRVWSLNDPILRHVCTGHDKSITALAYSPNGETLTSASQDNTLRIWQLSPNTNVEEHAPIDEPQLIAKRPIVSSNTATSLLGGWFNSAPPQIRVVHPEPISDDRSLPHIICANDKQIMHLAYHPDNETLIGATHDGHLYQWRISDGELVYSLVPTTPQPWTHFALSPLGRTFAIADNLLIRIWSLNGELLYTLRGHAGGITSLAYNNMGTLLASAGGQDQTIRLWQTDNGKLKNIMTSELNTDYLAFDPTGQLLATASGEDIHIWDISKKKPKTKFKTRGKRKKITNLAWLPNSNAILVTCNTEIQASTSKGKSLQYFGQHRKPITSLASSHDGQHFISGSQDNTLHYYSLEQRKPLHICTAHTKSILAAACSHNGRTLASASEDGSVRIWLLG